MEPRPRRGSRWLLGVLLCGACLAVSLLGVADQLRELSSLHGPPPVVLEPSQMLHSRTIVAYSLERQVEMEQRVPISCLNPVLRPRPWEVHRDNAYWQRPNDHVYLYSAHYDVRLPQYPYVRVIGMVEGRANTSLFCQVWFESRLEPIVLEVLEIGIWVPEWDEKAGDAEVAYRPVLLSCPIPRDSIRKEHIPSAVSIVQRPCEHATTLLDVAGPDRSPKKDFAVCVKGLDFPIEDISRRLVEWFELNVLLGVDKMFVYVYSVHSNIKRVLNYYSSLGVVKVIPLSLPGRQPNTPLKRSEFLRSQLWQKRRNELVPYNDCYYRNLYTHKYVVPLDIDEVIVPVRVRTWSEVLDGLDPKSLENFSSFSVRNAYFFDSFPVSGEDVYPNHLHVLRHTTRSANLSREDEAVKSFVSTGAALTVFNHYTLRTLDPAVRRNLVLDSSLVQMNHYKAECSPVMVPDCVTNFLRYRTEDRLVWKYGPELAKRVEPILRKLRLL